VLLTVLLKSELISGTKYGKSGVDIITPPHAVCSVATPLDGQFHIMGTVSQCSRESGCGNPSGIYHSCTLCKVVD